MRLWQRDGTPLATLEAHQSGVTGLAFTPQGDRLISASLDKTVIIWDLKRDLNLNTVSRPKSFPEALPVLHFRLRI